MKEFEVGDKVIIHKENWLKCITYPPSAYGIKFDNEYRVEKVYEKEGLIYIDGAERAFHRSFFIPVNMENSIAKPILEERKKDKIRMELVDQGFPLALLELAKVMTWANQNKGYKDHDWRNIPNAENSFKGAAARHRVKFDAQRSFGNEMLDCTDEESGIIHLAHEAFNVLALLELALVGKVK